MSLKVDTRPLIPPKETPKNSFDGLVSVIIPTFNCARTIGRSVASLQQQTYKNVEIIVVDDASTDHTQRVVEAFDGVKYLRLETNSGAAVARNEGAKLAQGELYLFAEADGFYDNDYVEKNLWHMHLPGVVAAINLGRKVWTDRDTALTRLQNALLETQARRVEEGKRGTGAWLFHKEPYWAVGGYDPACRIGQDMDLVRRLIEAGGKTTIGGHSTLHHKDPDTLRLYLRRAHRSGLFSGNYQAKWSDAGTKGYMIRYLVKFVLLALAPVYFVLAFAVHWLFNLPFLAALAFLLVEDRTTTETWTMLLRRGDIRTFLMTPVLLYMRRLALGVGKIRSFFKK